jgi:mono/diheme cytochrome c family protein
MRLWRIAMLRFGLVLILGCFWLETSWAGSASPDLVQQGKATYAQFCLYCHGPNMVNAGTASFDLRRFPRDQRQRFFKSVSKGKGRMPAFGGVLTEAEFLALWAYVCSGGKP